MDFDSDYDDEFYKHYDVSFRDTVFVIFFTLMVFICYKFESYLLSETKHLH
jgi:hypothetical protein